MKDVRKLRGLTQRELAELSGVSLSLIRKLERGERGSACMETLRALAQALRVPTVRLAGGIEPDGPVSGAADRWADVRRALERPPVDVDTERPTVAGVRDVVAAVLPAFHRREPQPDTVQSPAPRLMDPVSAPPLPRAGCRHRAAWFSCCQDARRPGLSTFDPSRATDMAVRITRHHSR